MSLETKRKNIIVNWLWLGLFMVVLMVVIGGITRLTHSGLSMVEWKLIGGTIPPLNQEAWEVAFEKYKQFPEYQINNQGMSLSEFKAIFFWEYLHRMIGRLLGLVFIIPFGFFLLRKWTDRNLTKKLVILLFLGALQGGIGWFMVKSGLVDRPSVSHFRLALHLIAAFSLIAYIFCLILELQQKVKTHAPKIFALSIGMLVLAIMQITYGAFTAGLKAGLMYPTFPDMAGNLFPHNIGSLDFLNDPGNIQFVHRMFGWLLLLFAIFLWQKIKQSTVDNRAGNLLLLAICLQFILGVTTLLLGVPILIAVIHQVGAIFVLLVLCNLIYTTSGKQHQ